MHFIPIWLQRVFKYVCGIWDIRDNASWNEFHLVAVGTMSFTSSTSSDASVKRLALVHKPEHLPMTLLYIVLNSLLVVSHFSTSLRDTKLSMWEAQLRWGGRVNCPSDSEERAWATSVNVTSTLSNSSSESVFFVSMSLNDYDSKVDNGSISSNTYAATPLFTCSEVTFIPPDPE